MLSCIYGTHKIKKDGPIIQPCSHPGLLGHLFIVKSTLLALRMHVWKHAHFHFQSCSNFFFVLHILRGFISCALAFPTELKRSEMLTGASFRVLVCTPTVQSQWKQRSETCQPVRLCLAHGPQSRAGSRPHWATYLRTPAPGQVAIVPL